MKFKLATSRAFYGEDEQRKLKQLGFKFTDESFREGIRFVDYDSLPEIEINTIKDLLNLRDQCKVMGFTHRGHARLIVGADTIEIYDGYRE